MPPLNHTVRVAPLCRHGSLSFIVNPTQRLREGEEVTLAIRPEKIKRVAVGGATTVGRVDSIIYMGTDTLLSVCINADTRLEVRCQNSNDVDDLPSVGADVGIHIADGAAAVLED